jgi:lipid-A-disaccharide synthase
MLVIFPFEEPFYRERGVEAEFVGHPLAELPLPSISREQFAAENGLDPAKTWIGLLPGSRPRRFATICRRCCKAAALEKLAGPAKSPSFEFLVPLAPTLTRRSGQGRCLRLVENHGCGLDIRLVDDARAALLHARASVVASGTATVEAALIGNPFVVVYRVSP